MTAGFFIKPRNMSTVKNTMATKNNGKLTYCEVCGNTGIVSAVLVKNKNTNAHEKIVVKSCGRHFNDGLLKKNVGLLETRGLPVEVIVAVSDDKSN